VTEISEELELTDEQLENVQGACAGLGLGGGLHLGLVEASVVLASAVDSLAEALASVALHQLKPLLWCQSSRLLLSKSL
jgi:hypothetical protein